MFRKIERPGRTGALLAEVGTGAYRPYGERLPHAQTRIGLSSLRRVERRLLNHMPQTLPSRMNGTPLLDR